jgi:hypothetical protein
MIERSTKELRGSTVRSVKTYHYDDPGGNHLSPMITYTVKFIYKDILQPGMFCGSSLPCLTSSFTYHFHYLRWTSLIIHLAMLLAILSGRTHRSYKLGRERGVMFCISYLHIYILQTGTFLRLDMLSRLSLMTERESRKHKAPRHSPSLVLCPFLHCRKAIWLLKGNPCKRVYTFSGIASGRAGSVLLARFIYHQLYVLQSRKFYPQRAVRIQSPIQNYE